MSNLVIRNTQPRLVQLPPVQPGYSSYRLSPGENDVPSEYWAVVTKNRAVKGFLAAKILENLGEGKAQALINNLDKLHPSDALKHISKCENVKLLNDWKKGTESIGLRTAFEERIGELIASQTGTTVSPETSSADKVEAVVEAELTD